MTQDEAKQLQRAIWQLSANELNRCSVEPGNGPGEWVVDLVWKDGRHEQHPSLEVELRDAAAEEDLRHDIAKADAAFRELEDE